MSILLVLRLLGIWNTMKPFEIALHLAENKKAWAGMRKGNGADGYIEDQESLRGFVYGKKTFDSLTRATVGENRVRKDGYIDGQSNLCGVIAIYNALVFLGQRRELYSIIEAFETSGVVLNGCMGTSPHRIEKYLKENGIKAALYSPGSSSGAGDEDACIFGCFNSKKGVKSGMHIMCATREKDGCRVHNGGLLGRKFESFREAAGAYNNGESRPVFMIGIKQGARQ